MTLIVEIALGVALAPITLLVGAFIVGIVIQGLSTLAEDAEHKPKPEPRPHGMFNFNAFQWASGAGTGVYWDHYSKSWSENTWREDHPRPNSGKVLFFDFFGFGGEQTNRLLLQRETQDWHWKVLPSLRTGRQVV